jgi:asparagine synthase (glutamine-hydrolysing)
MNSNLLLTTLRAAVSDLVAEESRAAVAYSGGLDSSILAALASEKTSVICYTCATKGSFDDLNARQCADEEGRKLSLIELKAENVEALARRASRILDTSDPVKIAYTIPILCVLQRSAERTVLAGSGADELFGGYANYSRVGNPAETMAADLAKMICEARLLASEATALGKIIGFPYATATVISAAVDTPLEKKVSSAGRKIILREVAEILGLSSRNRPKKAAQYSSGVLRAMERLAREQGLNLSHWTARMKAEGE